MLGVRTLFVAVAVLGVLPATAPAQGTSGTGRLGGTIQTAFTISAVDNGVLVAAMGTFGPLTAGQNSLIGPTPVAFRIRSNAPYKLMVQVGALVGMTDGVPSGGADA